MKLAFVKTLAACLFGLALLAPAAGAEEKMTLNFVDADIHSVIKAISKITGHNFLVDPRVKGTVNIVTGKPVSSELAYQILLSALRMQGFAVVESGNIAKILPEADAKTHPGPTGKGRVVQQGEQTITQIFQIRNETAVQLLNVVKPLISANSSISANPGNNTLVITDYADNLKRIQQIIEAIDVARSDEPVSLPVHNVSAVELAATLNRFFAEQPSAAGGAVDNQRLTIIADSKTNSLIVRSDNPSKLARVRNLAAQMDADASRNSNIHVVPLKHADAAKLAQTLKGILSGAGEIAPPTAAGAAPPGVPPSAPPTAVLAGGAVIQADTNTNSLIITAPRGIYNNLLGVIDQLDRRRAQVYIEALVVELSAERAAEFGVQWQSLSSSGNPSVVGGTNFNTGGNNIINASRNLASVGKGLNVGIINGQIELPGIGSISNLGLLAKFLETDNNGNVLSTPNILTLDNEEAKIVVGQNVPFITGSYAQTGNTATATPFQTFERKDVGLTLRVKPQITEGGIVRVQIYQEASSVQSGTATSTSGPITNKRSLESTVLVDSGSIIALGGLVEDNQSAGAEKVPFLGDLPLIGPLFRYQSRQRKKTNLMIFLRPQIIRNEQDYRTISEKNYEQIRQQQEKVGNAEKSTLQDDTEPPLLPPLRGERRLNAPATTAPEAAPAPAPISPSATVAPVVAPGSVSTAPLAPAAVPVAAASEATVPDGRPAQANQPAPRVDAAENPDKTHPAPVAAVVSTTRGSATGSGAPKVAAPVPPPAFGRLLIPSLEYWIQAGSFSERERAEELRATLQARGFESSIFVMEVADSPRYRVRIGPYGRRSEASALLPSVRQVPGCALAVVAKETGSRP